MIDTKSEDFQAELNFARRGSRRRAVLMRCGLDWITGNGVALFVPLFLPLFVDLPEPLASNPPGHPIRDSIGLGGGDRGGVGDLEFADTEIATQFGRGYPGAA
jgi:hypothetical protein